MLDWILSAGRMPHPRDGEVLAELDAILASPSFAGSARSRAFLKFVVTEMLAGRASEIKERTIAMEVFGREAGYDPAHDSIVRVKALEVRKRLAEYYRKQPHPSLRIDLPSGRYVPALRPLAGPSSRLPAWPKVALAAVLAVGALLAVWRPWTQATGPEAAFNALWAPAIEAGMPVLISLPSPKVWDVSSPGGELPASGAVPAEMLGKKFEYYVGTGAAYGAAQFAAILGAKGVPFVIKVGPEVTLEDLKRQPALLLGAISSEWTIKITSRLRFSFFEDDTSTGIIDRENELRRWLVPRQRHSEAMTEAIGMIVRMPDSETGQPIFIAAGSTARGTHMAAEFLTSPALFQEFAAAAPPGWERRNLQVVLRAEVYRNRPGRPEILAWHVW